MKKFNINKIIRLIVQILFFIFFPGLVGSAFLEIKVLFVDIFTANFASIIGDTSLIIVLLLSTIFFGRFFCGWMCMFGTYNDIVNLIGKKVFKIKYKINPKVDSYLKYLKYVVLIFITCFIWTSLVTIPSGSSPWDALMQLTNPTYAFNNYLIGLIILVFITIGDLFVERFFCRYLCPLGAIFSIVSKGRILSIKKERTVCSPCKACTHKCSMGINLDNVDYVTSGECINCLNCTKICPKNNAHLALNKKAVNEYAAVAVAVAGTTGLYLATDKIASNYIDTSSTSEVSVSKYADGTYIGTGTGYKPNLKVSVTISNGKITDITVYSSNETESFFNKAWNTIKNAIISKQSTDVNTVSGATRSSEGIIEAVNNALTQAEEAQKVETTIASETTTTSVGTTTTKTTSTTTKTTTTATTTASSSTSTTYKDGTYTGTGVGYKPYTKVTVTISNGKISSITLVSTNDTDKFFTKAWSTIKNAIISKQSTTVSTVSGATRSSEGIIEAVNDALSQAQ